MCYRFVAGVDETTQLQIVTRGDDALFPKGAPQAAYSASQSPSLVKTSFEPQYCFATMFFKHNIQLSKLPLGLNVTKIQIFMHSLVLGTR